MPPGVGQQNRQIADRSHVHTQFIYIRLPLCKTAAIHQRLSVQILCLLKVVVDSVKNTHQIEQHGTLVHRGFFRVINPPQTFRYPDSFGEAILIIQKTCVLIQRIQLDPVLFRQGRDSLVNGNDLRLGFGRHAGGAEGLN